MAVTPPTAPPAQPPTTQPAAPPVAPKRSRGCFGCGCGGCLLVIVLVVLLAGGGSWWFLTNVSAAVTAPASLIVVNQPITVDGNPGIPGQNLNAGNTVATGSGGHGGIQFPDGSYIRMSPDTTVQVTSVQLQHNGNVQAIAVLQKAGRTFTNVQHLSTGSTFTVGGGHSVSAEVRGTKFEVIVRANGTNVIRVFEGTVKANGNGKTVTVKAGQEVETDTNGNVSAPRPITRDPQDPYAVAAQCSSAVSGGTTPGTSQTSTGDSITTGQTAEVDYSSPGGTVTMALCYPGSAMSVTLIDPAGGSHVKSGSGGAPVVISADGPPGMWKAIVRAVDVPNESYAVSFASNAPCSPDSIDNGGVVRETLSNTQISSALAESGLGGVTIYVQGTSPTSARIVYYSDVGGQPVSWTIDFYAATPKLGAVITQASIHGINVTTQLISNLSSVGGYSISSIPTGFVVDRVYSCAQANGDNMVVVEGHR